MSDVQMRAFTDLSGAPLVRMLSIGWDDLGAHAWDHPDADAAFWTLYRNQADGASITTRQGTVILGAGQVYLIPPRVKFSRRNDQATSHVYAYFDVLGFDSTSMPMVIPIPGASGLTWLAALASAPCKPTPADALRLSGLVLQALAPLLEKSDDAPVSLRIRTGPALAAMQMDPARMWSLPELAALCDYAPDTFGRHFRSAYGLTPVQWLRFHRARMAAHRLATTPDSLERIARDLGFNSRPYLSRVFHKLMGVGPSEYRRANSRGQSPLGPRGGH